MSIASNFSSVRPSLLLDFANVGRLDPRVTFTRASSATYYDGVTTAKAEQNLLLQSQAFDAVGSWPPLNATVDANTADTTAPDGTSTAEKITDDATDSSHRIEQNIASVIAANTTYAASVFAKKGTHDFMLLTIGDAGTSERYFCAVFDLDAGTVSQTANGTSGTLTSSSITSVGNGWYRCAIIGSLAAVTTSRFRIQFAPAASGNTITNFGGITYVGTSTSFYLWGAQLEQRSAVTAYTATTTQAITNYIPVLQTAAAGVPRFDHVPTTGVAEGLLIEEQRSNLLTYSEDFADAAWVSTTTSLQSNIIIAPDGTLTGDKWIPNSGQAGGATRVQVVSKSAAATTYTYTLYAKAAEFVSFRLYVNDIAGSANRCEATYNLSTGATSSVANAGTFSGASASITLVGNGWYRCVLILTTSTETNIQVRVQNAGSGQTGDGYSGVYIWGADLEVGAFPTSYIKTTSASATRNADVASMTGTNFSSWFNNAEGTLYGETQKNYSGSTAFPRIAQISDSTNNNAIIILWSDSISRLYAAVNVSGVTQADPGNNGLTQIAVHKSAFAYKVNDFAISNDGLSAQTDTSGTIPTVDRMFIGKDSGVSYFNGTIRKIAFYPQRLSDAQLQALTG